MESKRSCGGRVVLCALMLVLVFSVMSCGKKGDPIYPRVVYPDAVSDLGVTLRDGGMELAWTLPTEGGEIARVRIFKSEVSLGGTFCATCPRTYTLAGEFSYADPILSKQGDGTMGYRDGEIRTGHLYSYRVQLCTSPDVCSEESNVAEARYE